MNIFRRSAVLFASVSVGAIVLAGCSSSDTAAQESDSIVVVDQWTKAADKGMTGMFATIENSSGSDITVVSATSPISERVELHEVTDGKMRQKEGGYIIPANGSHTLAPGADHIMLMDLGKPVEPGSDVEVTLTLGDGTTTTFTAQARDFSGGNEEYGDKADGDMSGMDHGSMEGMDHGSTDSAAGDGMSHDS